LIEASYLTSSSSPETSLVTIDLLSPVVIVSLVAPSTTSLIVTHSSLPSSDLRGYVILLAALKPSISISPFVFLEIEVWSKEVQ
jgi:hypothetical protein